MPVESRDGVEGGGGGVTLAVVYEGNEQEGVTIFNF